MDIHKAFLQYEEKVSFLAKQFQGLIQKLRNVSSSEVRIINDLSHMRKQLEKHLNDVTDFNTNIQTTGVKIVGELTQIDRKTSILNEEKDENEQKRNQLNEELEGAKKKLIELKKEKDEFNDRLETLKAQRDELEERQKNTFYLFLIPVAGWIAATILLIYNSTADIEVKISRVDEALESWNTKISDFQEKIEEYAETVRIKHFNIWICNRKKKDVMEKQDILKKYQHKINQWLKALNEWLYFLIDLEPQVERVERNIGNNENALHRAIEDLKNAITKTGTQALEAQAKNLAITENSTNT